MLVIQGSHRHFSKPYCGKEFSKPPCEAQVQHSLSNENKVFVARGIQYFELGIFSFNSYVYYLPRGFIASTRAFNLLTRDFNLPTRAFSLPTRTFNLATGAFSVLTIEFELATRGFELVTRVLLFRGRSLNVFFFLLPIMLSELHEKPRGKD